MLWKDNITFLVYVNDGNEEMFEKLMKVILSICSLSI